MDVEIEINSIWGKRWNSQNIEKIWKNLQRMIPVQSRIGILVSAIGSGCIGYNLIDSKRRRNVELAASGLVRFIRTLTIGGIISADYWISIRKNPDILSACHLRCSSRILDGCLQNGGVYIKLGQGLVAMNHILPEEYLDTLEVLHDKALRNLPFSEVEQMFIEDFGKKPADLFAEFETNCVAAASLAQVFKAKMKNGQDVAVKVQYSDLQDRFTGDVWALGILVSIAGWMHPDYNFKWVLDYLRDSLVKELDFKLEANNMKKCASQLANLDFVIVPKVIEPLSSKRVLTMDWIDGIKINQKKRLLEKGYSLYDVDYKLITAFSQQIFQHGFLHADPHPGNVLVVHNSKDPRYPHLALLDHGLYEHLDEKDRIELCSLWKSIVFNNDTGMAKHSNNLGVPTENYKVFCEILVQRPLLFRNKTGIPLSKGLSASEVKYMKEMASKRFMTCLKALPRPMLLVFRNINTVRSIAKLHKHPVDRFAVMARIADKALIEHGMKYISVDSSLFSVIKRSYSLFMLWIVCYWRRLKLELSLVSAWIFDRVASKTQQLILYMNADLSQALKEIEEKNERRNIL